MGYTILHITNWLLWIIMAVSVFYVFFFSLASLLPRHRLHIAQDTKHEDHFIILFPAYHEDAVIVPSVEGFLKQTYPATHYQVIVISDHMLAETNQKLSLLPIMLLQFSLEKSSKAKSMQYAMNKIERSKKI